MTLRMDNANIIRITTDSPQLIRVDNAKIISTSELLDMVEQVDYIKLDSSEPIGEISKMVVTKDKIFILDSFRIVSTCMSQILMYSLGPLPLFLIRYNSLPVLSNTKIC